MTQIQNNSSLPGALGGLGVNNPAARGKDGASPDFSRWLNQSSQQLQNQSAMTQLQSQLQTQQLAAQQLQTQQQAQQLQNQQQTQRQNAQAQQKSARPPENTAAQDENKLAARNAAARNSAAKDAAKADDAKAPARPAQTDGADHAQAAGAADAVDPRDTAVADAAQGKDAERVEAKDGEGKDKKAAKDAKEAGATPAEQILAMLRGDAPAEAKRLPRGGAGHEEGQESGTDALPGGAQQAHGKHPTTGDAMRERQELQRELSQAAAGKASAGDAGADKASSTEALQAASAGAHEISMGDGPKGPQQSFEALLAAAQQPGAATDTAGADAPSATQAPSVPLSQPLDSPDFAPELSATVSLLIRDGIQEAQLQLNPTDMGPVSINIQLEGQQAQVNFHAQHAATREVLERSLPDLAAALQAQGLTLSGGGVFAQAQSSGGQNRGDGSSDGASNGNGRRGGRGNGDDDGAIAATGRGERRSAPRGLVDLYA